MLRAVRVFKLANPSTNVYRPFPGTNTPTATLGKLFRFAMSSISRSRLRATRGANRWFEPAAADHDAIESKRRSAQRHTRSLKCNLIETLRSLKRGQNRYFRSSKPARMLFSFIAECNLFF